MLKGLTQAGLGKFDKIEEFAAKAAEYDFAAIDCGPDDLCDWVERQGLEQAQAFLRERNMIIGAMHLPVEWRSSEQQFKEGMTKLAHYAATAANLGCTRCSTYVLPSTDDPAAPFMAQATVRLRRCAQILSIYGISLAIEFVGPHHLRTAWKHPFIWTMGSTLDWIDAIGECNVGLLLDSYHWYTTESTVEDILSLRADRIVHVHLNDARNVPVDEALDHDRLYPGEGVINLSGFLKALDRIGYDGVVSQEVLTPRPPTESNEILLRRSAHAFQTVFSEAGLTERIS